MRPASPPTASLTFDAASEWLRGEIPGNRPFFMRAFSGGSRGHNAKVTAAQAASYLHAQSSSTSSHLTTTPERTDAHGHYLTRGGPLPAGHYTCRYIHHLPGFGECIRLVAQPDTVNVRSPFASLAIPHGRDMHSFLIHGHGPKGSDGCIVPEQHLELERHRLNLAVKGFPGRVVLQVINVSYALPAERFDGVRA